MALAFNEIFELQPGDVEVRGALTLNLQAIEQRTIVDHLSKFSSWSQAVKAIACIQRQIRRFKMIDLPTVEKRERAKHIMIKHLQKHVFQEELKVLSKGTSLPSLSELYNINPFLDSDVVLKVGGRLDNMSYRPFKHPVIFPKQHHITRLIIADYHEGLSTKVEVLPLMKFVQGAIGF